MIPLTEIAFGEVKISHRIGEKGKRGIIVLNISQKCPLKCIYCYSSSTIGGKELDKEGINIIVREIEKISPRLVIISGGEPLLYSHIDYLLQELSKRRVRIVISSNGMFINNENIKLLKNYNIDYVGVSLDIPSQEDSKIRIGSSFYKIVETIRILTHNSIETGIRMTLTWTSMYTIENMLKLCRKYDVHRLCIYHLVPSGRGLETYKKLKPPPEVETIFLIHLLKILREYRNIDVLTVTEPSDYIVISLLSSRSKKELEEKIERFSKRSRCNAGKSILSIYPDLSVYPCQFDNKNKLGDLRERSLTDLIHEEYEYCRGCKLWEYCRGCRLRLRDNIDEDCTLMALYRLVRTERVIVEDWKKRFLKETFEDVRKVDS
ncbi:MAG: radical SAM protein [Crenarchaeota archaeon]|nr:radical SAM protein [Thermoproteota archaeon]